jgi:hypothetical protein
MDTPAWLAQTNTAKMGNRVNRATIRTGFLCVFTGQEKLGLHGENPYITTHPHLPGSFA